MALIKCSECGKEISDKAVSCPHCGNKINKSDGMKLANAFGYMLIIFFIISFIIAFASLPK